MAWKLWLLPEKFCTVEKVKPQQKYAQQEAWHAFQAIFDEENNITIYVKVKATELATIFQKT